MEKDNYRIRLRPINKKDTHLIVKWRNNDNVKKNFVFQEKFTEELHNKWMDDKVASGSVVQFIIIEKETNDPIGSVYFRDIDYDKKIAEFGIFIGEDSKRGKGFGNEAVELALQYGFDMLKLNEIFLRVYADNKAAVKSYEKVGFNKYKEVNSIRKMIFMKKKRKK